MAALILSSVMSNPTFERPEQVEKSANGDGLFNELIGANPFNESLVDECRKFVGATRSTTQLFVIGSMNGQYTRLTAAIFGSISRSGIELDIEPSLVISRLDFLVKQAELNPLQLSSSI